MAGVDYGRKRIGIAICDARRIIASPLCQRHPSGDRAVEGAFYRKLVAAEGIVGFVVGLPVHADGTDSRMSVEVEQFGLWLSETTGCPAVFHDERYSSVEASARPAPTLSPPRSFSPRGWRPRQTLPPTVAPERSTRDSSPHSTAPLHPAWLPPDRGLWLSGKPRGTALAG